MEEDGSNSQQYQFLLRHPRSSSNKPRLGGGEIVEVQGGHIIRSTGRKDRHSKVCTAKGPRDRRVRLSAHTAIQFYDVQDRLGYDRPSKAVDWLIKNAKPAIDELAKLPPWTPSQPDYPITKHSEFLPPSLDSDAIADTIKSFFPAAPASPVQDLRLSLQSFQHPILHHNNPISTAAGYDASPASWSDWGGGGGGFMCNASPVMAGVPLSSILGQTSFASQRGTLQSSGNSASGRAWIDPMAYPTDDGGAHGFGGFSGFRIPARIQGEDDHDGGGFEKLSCASRR